MRGIGLLLTIGVPDGERCVHLRAPELDERPRPSV